MSHAALAKRWLSPPEVAKQYRIGTAKVLSWIATGELAAFNAATKPGARPRYLVDAAALERFEKSRAVVPVPPSPVRHRRQHSDIIEFV